MPKEIVGFGGELHTFFGSPRSYLLICMLFVCHLRLGNKVNLLREAIYGVSFTDRVEPFFFPCSCLFHGGVTKCCIVPFCLSCKYKVECMSVFLPEM